MTNERLRGKTNGSKGEEKSNHTIGQRSNEFEEWKEKKKMESELCVSGLVRTEGSSTVSMKRANNRTVYGEEKLGKRGPVAKVEGNQVVIDRLDQISTKHSLVSPNHMRTRYIYTRTKKRKPKRKHEGSPRGIVQQNRTKPKPEPEQGLLPSPTARKHAALVNKPINRNFPTDLLFSRR